MTSFTILTLGLLFICVTHTCFGNSKYQYKKTHHYSSSLTPFRRLYGLSLNACVYQCSIRKKCKSVNYKSRSQTCELHDATGTPDVNKNEPSVYIEHDIPDKSCGCADHEVCTNTATSTCSVEECEPLTSVNNGKIFGNMNKIGSKLKVMCDSGFVEKEGRMFTICLDDGTWQFLPECLSKTITTPVTTTLPPSSTTGANTASRTSRPTTTIASPSSATTKTAPETTSTTSATTTTVPGSITTAPATTTTPPGTTSIASETTITVPGDTTATDIAITEPIATPTSHSTTATPGTTSTAAPTASTAIPDCGTPIIANGNVNVGTTTYGSTATVSCNPGYDSSVASIACLATGLWEAADCSCNQVDSGEIFEQWVFSVESFSSEFNAATFAATQAIGIRNVHPAYGDIRLTWTPLTLDANQYITVKFEVKVVVTAIDIYETFHAGGVKQISAVVTDPGTDNAELLTLSIGTVQDMEKSRIFSPTLRDICVALDTIRIDIDCTLAGTWVKIDAVKLHGRRVVASDMQRTTLSVFPTCILCTVIMLLLGHNLQ